MFRHWIGRNITCNRSTYEMFCLSVFVWFLRKANERVPPAVNKSNTLLSDFNSRNVDSLCGIMRTVYLAYICLAFGLCLSSRVHEY